MSRPITNFYAPATTDRVCDSPVINVNPDSNYLYVSYNHISDRADIHGDFYLFPQPTFPLFQPEPSSILSNRRGAIDYGISTRSPLSPVNFHAENIRRSKVLPQKILNPPRSEKDVQSIWFKTKRPDSSGISMVDALENKLDEILAKPLDEVLKKLSTPEREIKFNILWPGYGHISWMASIPTLMHDENGEETGGVTRAKLATAVSQHFQAFMTYHATLRFAHPEPFWKISNQAFQTLSDGPDREEGIRFEQLQLLRLFCCKEDKYCVEENSSTCGWQAEVLVVNVEQSCFRNNLY